MLHELGVHADGGEAGEGIDLIDHHPVGTMLHKEIAAGQALAVQGGVGHGGVGLDLVQLSSLSLAGMTTWLTPFLYLSS